MARPGSSPATIMPVQRRRVRAADEVTRRHARAVVRRRVGGTIGKTSLWDSPGLFHKLIKIASEKFFRGRALPHSVRPSIGVARRSMGGQERTCFVCLFLGKLRSRQDDNREERRRYRSCKDCRKKGKQDSEHLPGGQIVAHRMRPV